MTALRVLHVDDEADIREVVKIALELDPEFVVRSCASGEEAIVEVAAWTPDLILCDVMMPLMDGPALLSRLHESQIAASVPCVFMTARAQETELARLRLLGAVGTIAKPFDPMSLSELVRYHITSSKLAALTNGFDSRLRADLATLVRFRMKLRDNRMSANQTELLKSCAHKLSGAAGIFGYQDVSDAASRLEESVLAERSGLAQTGITEARLDELVDCIRRQPVLLEPGNGGL
jgi:CheY-like chemotaxis protein